jgi:hypothetical protein
MLHEIYVAGAVDERRAGGLNVELYQGSLLEKDAWKARRWKDGIKKHHRIQKDAED